MLQELREQLDRQIAELDRELRIELPRLIAEARALGDLRENAEYTAALERQELVRARLAQLTRRQSELSAIDLRSVPRDQAGFGSRVQLEDETGDRNSWQLVFPEFADFDDGMISLASPLGRAILGARPGDRIQLDAPSGARSFQVVEILTLHGCRHPRRRGERPWLT
jgi:transcription elongation factor GreA